ncbi:phenazine-specific anthranilate synthase component I [Kribbella antibiotica]|uniref:anthranilate synthase n=1 Tax=Kribbella antibiotica TaxID=190195 RepID=A0A4R4ZV04_9ACTN|nr:anthranilate synthase family protein [Kribbella antibiotica]TDD62705.1 phenazine-specific anthranilate synthase component I [Kribbella antibiotica]
MSEPVDITSLLRPGAPPFALLYRPESTGGRMVDVITGDIVRPGSLAELPDDVLAVLPYKQVAERGFDYPDDDAELLGLTVRNHRLIGLAALLEQLPEASVELSGAGFDLDDDQYAGLVRQLIDDEIGQGEGSNFVLRRSFTAQVRDWSPVIAGTLFRRLLEQESGAYWTFLVHTGEQTFIGASPERQVTLTDGLAVMNPISGTYRYPQSGPDMAGVLTFLDDGKESDELFMVLDEELKMMGGICPNGGRVVGPFLKEMAHLAHTEYFIEGETDLDAREVLRRTLFAPTVIGSPLESACRAVARYEPSGRGYYGGAVALLGRDAAGRSTMDSAILIRSAQVAASGQLTFGVGATVVRHSDPDSEAAETRAKASGLLRALSGPVARTGRQLPVAGLGADPRVQKALAARNDILAPFWLRGGGSAVQPLPAETRVLVIDAEDDFTSMLALEIGALGAEVAIIAHDQPFDADQYDVVVLGPGPGDPRDRRHPKIAALRERASWLVGMGKPVLAVCLGHQVISQLLGLSLVRRDRPYQGAQHTIDLFGQTSRVGFYSSFAARSAVDEFWSPVLQGPVELSRDRHTGEVHALVAPRLRSFQFHPESVLSPDGFGILESALSALTPARVSGRCEQRIR